MHIRRENPSLNYNSKLFLVLTLFFIEIFFLLLFVSVLFNILQYFYFMHYALCSRHLFVTRRVLEIIEIDQVGYGVLSRDQKLHRNGSSFAILRVKDRIIREKTAKLANVILNLLLK